MTCWRCMVGFSERVRHEPAERSCSAGELVLRLQEEATPILLREDMEHQVVQAERR